MTHKIAIITTSDHYHQDDYDSYSKVIDSITDWADVSDEDYRTLQAASGMLNYRILEQPADLPKFVAKTVADYKAWALAAEAKAAEEKKKREAAALDRKMKKELKGQASKAAMLKKLAEELGVDLTGLPKEKLPI